MTAAPKEPTAANVEWQLGNDNLARHTLSALNAAGITIARAERMTLTELAATPGLGKARLQRVTEALQRRHEAPRSGNAATGVPTASAVQDQPGVSA